jgi:alpha-ribazole phosphatase/probable phosphoglycerate mutase
VASTWVYLARHGEVEGAAEGRFFGHADVPLSAHGRVQADALAALLGAEPVEAVYASDLCRARDSAAPLARRRGVAVVALPELREMAMGRWERLTFAEMRAREPDAVARWLADTVAVPFPGGESLDDLRRRVVPAVEALVARPAGSRVVVVAHGGTNRVILAEALGLPLANALRLGQDYAAVSLVEYAPRGTTVHWLNRRAAGPGGAVPVERAIG